jgi:hypothetical protein
MKRKRLPVYLAKRKALLSNQRFCINFKSQNILRALGGYLVNRDLWRFEIYPLTISVLIQVVSDQDFTSHSSSIPLDNVLVFL